MADSNEVYWDTMEGDNEDTLGDSYEIKVAVDDKKHQVTVEEDRVGSSEVNTWSTMSKNIRLWWRWL